MKTNRIILLTSVLCFSLLATGCGEPLQEMTSEEEAIVSLYAAKAVAKFNKNQIIGIANARVKKGELDEEYKPAEEEEEAEEIEGEENSEEAEIEIDSETGEPIPREEGADEAEAGGSGKQGYSFTNAVGVDGVSFVCSEFDVTSEFKPTSSYILSKVSGKKYVVLNITATNESSDAVDFSKYSKREFFLSLNGGEQTKSQFTPLTNDLANFKGELNGGESKDFVLVFLLSNSAVDNITSLELYVTSDGDTRGTSI